MSRYIDADAYAADLWKLRVNYQMLDDTHTADKIMHGIYLAERTLQEQPTVDAVPVEWINGFMNWLDSKGYKICSAVIQKMMNDFRADRERSDENGNAI